MHDIIAACKKEDPSAQRMLYEGYLPYIIGICRRFGLGESNLKDAVQEIFIEIFLSLDNFNPKKGDFKYWIKSIAIRKLIKLQRKLKGNKMVYLDQLFEEEAPKTDANLAALHAEYLMELIGTLPAGYRMVFNLFVIDGYSHKEIAAMLDIDTASSRSQLSRARNMLKKKLKEQHRKNKYGFI